jgi:hypothetical protein
MLHIFFIFAFTLLSAQGFAAPDEDGKFLTLEEINADLEAKKKSLEPFDPSKVKVDLESLGLDDVTEKTAVEKDRPLTEAAIPEEWGPEEVFELKDKDDVPPPKVTKAVKDEVKKTITPPLPKVKSATSNLPKVTNKIIKNKEKEGLSNQDAGAGILSRIKNLLNFQDGDKAGEMTKEKKEFINPEKKINLKKQKEQERQEGLIEKQEEERLEKLQILRDKYLRESDPQEGENYHQDYLSSSEDIIPQRKNLDLFMSEESPALPIVRSYRTRDNLHIPLVPTPEEKLDLLFGTISLGDISIFNEAFSYIKNPNARNKYGDTILTYALLLKKHPMVTSILAKGANPNMPNKLGYTPINIALELRDFQSLELLASNKADLKYVDAFGRNYLMHASRIGSLAAIDLFLSNGIGINDSDNDGFTALAIAYKHRQNVIATYLLKHGAKTWSEKPYRPEKQSLIKELQESWK